MLKIKCPSCSSEFNVGEEFLDKYVECGSCEYQFTVAESHITNLEKKNHYPVHKHNDLSTFSKTFDAATQQPVTTSKQEAHLSKLRQDDFLPEPLWKKAVNFLGWGILLGGAALITLGSLKNGFLMDAGIDKRFIIAGFIALVSSICFVIGAKYFKNAIPLIILAAAFMAALAYFLPVYDLPISSSREKPTTPDKPVKEAAAPAPSTNNEYLSITKLKEVCRYTPVQEAIDKAKARGDTQAKSVIAVWIQDAAVEQQYAIQDYYKNALGLKSRPSYYNRKDGALLILEDLTDFTIQDIAETSDIFGPMNDIYISQRLISIQYVKEKFPLIDNATKAALSDPSEGVFYKLNLQEAQHFNSDRVHAALQRLENATPRFTSDASTVFQSVLKRYREPRILNSASSCIMNWFKDDLNSLLPSIESAADFDIRGTDPQNWPQQFVTLFLKAGSLEMVSTVLELWKKDPTKWEPIIIDSGVDFTKIIADEVSADDRVKNLSIINILEKIDSPHSTPLLNSLSSKLDDTYAAALSSALN